MRLRLFYFSCVFYILSVILNGVSSKLQFGFLENELIPEYLSITAESSSSRRHVYKFIKHSMKELIKSYTNDTQIQIDYNEIFKNESATPGYTKFSEPSTWHTTCLYIGSNYTKLDSEIYKQFTEGIQIDLESSTFIYIPGKIMSAPIFLQNFTLIENKYPHITLMTAEYRAVDSNYVLKALFDNIEELKELYTNGMIRSEDFKLNKLYKNVPIYFEDKSLEEIVEKIYIIKNGRVLDIKGVTKKNYYQTNYLNFLE